MSDSSSKGFDYAKKDFSGLFRLKVVEIKQGDSPDNSLVTFRFPDGGTQYFKPGDLFAATFKFLADDDG